MKKLNQKMINNTKHCSMFGDMKFGTYVLVFFIPIIFMDR